MSVFSFNFLFSTLELFWKEHVRQLYDISSGKFSLHVSHVMRWSSLLATFSCFVFSHEIIHSLPWKVNFLLTPFFVCSTIFLFFFSSSFPKSILFLSQYYQFSPLEFTTFIGDISICLSKTLKYVLFDLIKELTYLPLKNKERIQAKRVTDGIISRTGKIFSSVLNIALMSTGGSMLDHVFFMHLLCTGISVAWIGSASRLSKLFILKEINRKE